MVWKREDVASDGSCFYRALFRAAKKHRIESLVHTLYECFGRKYNKRENEEEFVEMVRDSLSQKIKNGIFDIMANTLRENVEATSNIARQAQRESTMSLYETFQSLAKDDAFLYELYVNEQSRQFIKKFSKPETMLETTKEEFYNFLGDLVATKSVYASDYDISLVKFILDKCDTKIFLNLYNEHNSPLIRFKNDNPAINVERVNENHYMFWYEPNTNETRKRNNSRISKIFKSLGIGSKKESKRGGGKTKKWRSKKKSIKQ